MTRKPACVDYLRDSIVRLGGERLFGLAGALPQFNNTNRDGELGKRCLNTIARADEARITFDSITGACQRKPLLQERTNPQDHLCMGDWSFQPSSTPPAGGC
jgi:hypothetical protein